MTYNPPGSPLNYPANNTTPVRIFSFARAPTTSDYQNFKIRDFWIDSSSDDLWFLVDKGAGVSTWILLGGSATFAETLTGNTGGAVSPDASNNINIVGTSPFTVTGNPGTNTLTIDASGTLADTYTTDAGNAVPSGDVLNVLGGSNINTAGAGNTVTVNLDADITVDSMATSNTVTGLTIQDNDITADGTDANIDLNITPKGTGVLRTDKISSILTDDLVLTMGDAAGSNKFSVQNSAATEIINTNSNGWTTMPLQPSFLAYLATPVANVTGDGTIYTVIYDTEVHDQGADFNLGTSTFTAPVDGVYSFGVCTHVYNVTTAHVQMSNRLITSNGNYLVVGVDPGPIFDPVNLTIGFGTNINIFLDAGDTATVALFVDGSTKTIGATGTTITPTRRNYFSGTLIC